MRAVCVWLMLLAVSSQCIAAGRVDPRDTPQAPMHAYELYCWRTSQGHWVLSLLPKTSSEKTVDDVFKSRNTASIQTLRRQVLMLDSGAQIVVITKLNHPGGGPAPGSERLRTPPPQMLDDLRSVASSRGVTLVAEQPRSKVYEVYCWETPRGAWQFSLLPDTPLDRTPEEIFKNPHLATNIQTLERQIDTLENDAQVFVIVTASQSGPNSLSADDEPLPTLPQRSLDWLSMFASDRRIAIIAVEPVSRVYELYCWRTSEGWKFTLLPTTSRDKTIDEVFNNPDAVPGVEALERRLQALEMRARVVIVAVLRGPGTLQPPPGSEQLRVPPTEMLDGLRKSVSSRKIEIVE
jgi:hypothetical protein